MGNSSHSLTDSLHKIKELTSYNEWIYGNIKKAVSGNVLEIGCGIGNITDFLMKDAKKVTATDIDLSYINYAKKKYSKSGRVKVLKMDIMKPGKTIKKNYYDTAVMLNVLEHIKDDAKALRNACMALKKGGKFVILVPAVQAIYGEMDRELGHYKRYGKKDMKSLFEGSGMKINEIFYSNFPGMFGWFISGKVMKNKKIPLNQARVFDRYVLPVVKLTESVIKPFLGQSLIVIAEKK